MKILLNDNFSILEYLYLRTVEDEPESINLTMDFSECDCIVGLSRQTNFIGKTLILPTLKGVNLDHVKSLSQHNTVISRDQIPTTEDILYTWMPYLEVKIEGLTLSKTRNKPMSILSIKDYVITKYKGVYSMERSDNYLGVKNKGVLTIVGLLKHLDESSK